MIRTKLFVASDGTICEPGHPRHGQRYACHHARITSPRELRESLRAGPYAWPGGYAIWYLCGDGATLCAGCVESHYAQCARSTRDKARDGWRIDAAFLECDSEGELTCAQCAKTSGRD